MTDADSFATLFRAPVTVHGLLIHQEPPRDLDAGSLDTGCTIWPAARAAADALMERGGGGGSGTLGELVRGRRVLEIGAGTGLAGLACAAAGAAKVTLTDLPHRLPLLLRNVTANRWVTTLCACELAAAPLDWVEVGRAGDPALLRGVEVVIGTDLVHEVEHAQPVTALLEALYAASPGATLVWAQEAHNAMAVAALKRLLEQQLALTLVRHSSFGARGVVSVGTRADRHMHDEGVV